MDSMNFKPTTIKTVLSIIGGVLIMLMFAPIIGEGAFWKRVISVGYIIRFIIGGMAVYGVYSISQKQEETKITLKKE